MPQPIRFLEILEALAREETDFVVVGGVAAVLAGAPIATFDLDIVFENTEENRQRLLRALESMDALYLDPADRSILPDLTKLEQMNIHRLKTRYGVLDVLTEIGAAWRFEQLVRRSSRYVVEGLNLRVLALAALIEVKALVGRDKDMAMLPMLRRARDLRSESGDDDRRDRRRDRDQDKGILGR